MENITITLSKEDYSLLERALEIASTYLESRAEELVDFDRDRALKISRRAEQIENLQSKIY